MNENSYTTLSAEVDEILRESSGDGYPDHRAAHELATDAVEQLTRIDSGPSLDEWPKFTRMFGPFRPREFTVLCGTSGTGKTTLLANMSAQLMLGRIPHFVASVESGAVDYLLRVLSVMERRDINTGEPMRRAEAEGIVSKWRPVLERRMAIFAPYTDKVSPRRLLCDLLYAQRERHCRVAFIDNLNFLMPIVNGADANASMDRTIHDFVIFCKNVDMHIVMVMHPRKRENEEGVVRVENEYDIKGSSTVIQEAHNVILLNRPTKKQHEEGYDYQIFRELKFAKLRRRGRFTGSAIMYESLQTRYREVTDDEKRDNTYATKRDGAVPEKPGRYGADT